MTQEGFVIENKPAQTSSAAASLLGLQKNFALQQWLISFHDATPPEAYVILPAVGEQLLSASKHYSPSKESAWTRGKQYVYGEIELQFQDKSSSRFLWSPGMESSELPEPEWVISGPKKTDWVIETYQATRMPDTATDDPTIAKIRSLSQLRPDWDSYGGVPPSIETCARSIEFLSKLSQELSNLGEQMPKPFVAPCSDGSIQLEWEAKGKELHLVISPSFTFPLTFMTLIESAAGEEYREGQLHTLTEVRDALRWLISRTERKAV